MTSMVGVEIEAHTPDELVRLVRALGKHRYVASRLHLVHAFAVDAAATGATPETLAEAAAWAKGVLSDRDVDLGSKDERLYRRATDAELAAVLEVFFEGSPAAHAALRAHLDAIGAATEDASRLPFDEGEEEAIFPVLVDAGWELLPLVSLDPELHKGAIASFGDELSWQIARFEEENEVPTQTTLHELPLVGGVELLAAFEEARDVRRRELRAPFVLWESGHPVYLDYVRRGVFRAAKLSSTP
jgi:hypothetical protein